ncbi:methyltransferase domain-containing protein [Pseudodesulfovibrio sp. F-1]|uniref:Methyltransferase domain-containing protein n=1 Tax=Pseudodesulfovibrio alkaliphilus TaxID=2661613 RepID=A0A7K1KPU1_9BACT|nr:class I SAM-dependent methyltransferase [Pseudodesulfovibrio alkaliphilus]MUM78097.1 methyltransferase domain-containing protein [Pseudodesulfovibrio alkaliphilus]
MNCRHCQTRLGDVFIDLVNQPPSNSFLTREQLDEPETYFPLKLYVCPKCFLVQVDEYKKSQDIFSDEYVYFSSISASWVEHARKYVDMAEKRFALDQNSLIVEIASNDGYLLQWFAKKGVPCIGIEPTAGTAAEALKKGIDTRQFFFSSDFARRFVESDGKADLLLGNNVLAHVPNINDFVNGLKIALKPGGTITMEFPHLMQLVEHSQFDTIYHEHFSYLSLTSVNTIFTENGLTVFDVEQLPTHGGSLRIFARNAEETARPLTKAISAILDEEARRGMKTLEYYTGFQAKADTVKANLLRFLLAQKENGKKVAGYGAAAKGNTLLNYCGIKNDLISFCADASPYKQGLFLPGSHIPVLAPDVIKTERPDYIIILPWNIQEEIMHQHAYIEDWGGRFVTPIPILEIH